MPLAWKGEYADHPGRGTLLVAAFHIFQPGLLGLPRSSFTPVRPDVPLVALASNEKSRLMGEMAADLVKSGRRSTESASGSKVVRKASGEARKALARGRNVSTDGPSPDVWSPQPELGGDPRVHRVGDDKSDLIRPRDRADAAAVTIAMPRPMAEALGRPEKADRLDDILALAGDPRGWRGTDSAEWGRFRLGKTNLMGSTLGLHAVVGMYYVAN